MYETQIRDAFSLLRETCDPRGHSLLTALENLCIVESVAIDGILNISRELREIEERSNVVSLIDRYSVKA